MIDSINGERIIVYLDPELGPCISLSCREDCELLEYMLDAELYLPYWRLYCAGQGASGSNVYNFGSVVDSVKLQCILDTIEPGKSVSERLAERASREIQ